MNLHPSCHACWLNLYRLCVWQYASCLYKLIITILYVYTSYRHCQEYTVELYWNEQYSISLFRIRVYFKYFEKESFFIFFLSEYYCFWTSNLSHCFSFSVSSPGIATRCFSWKFFLLSIMRMLLSMKCSNNVVFVLMFLLIYFSAAFPVTVSWKY